MNLPIRPTVDILLATYNGERFLAEQLGSLEAQSFPGWRVVARDDGSSDATRAILGEFRARHPQRVELVEDGDTHLGAAQNFALLLRRSTAEYFMPCDQDDVWRPDKIDRLLALAKSSSSAGTPLLAHSDLVVVDRNLRPQATSFWRYQFIEPANCGWSRLLVQNVVTGCASLGNAALRRAALPIPQAAIMHDWWLALVAAATGEIRWTSTPTVLYRQHGNNDTGAKRWDSGYLLRHAAEFFRRDAFRAKMGLYRRQAAALARSEDLSLAPATREILVRFATLDTVGYPQRVALLWRHRILKTGLLRNLAMFARI